MGLRDSFRPGVGTLVVALFVLAVFAGAVQASNNVLLVCNGAGKTSCPTTKHFSSIQSAVDAASAGDFVLVWPGTYHAKGTADAGVLVTTPNIHIRGMDRNTVVVDGT